MPLLTDAENRWYPGATISGLIRLSSTVGPCDEKYATLRIGRQGARVGGLSGAERELVGIVCIALAGAQGTPQHAFDTESAIHR